MATSDSVNIAPINGSNNGTTVLEMVRKAMQDAEKAGEPAPGRVALRQLTNATDYQIQKALAVHEYLTDVVDSADGSSDDGAGEPSGSSLAGSKLVAWAGFAFGSIVSILANILAARIAPHDAPADWKPNVFAQVGAIVWPVALLIAVEVLSRIRWPKGFWWKLAGPGGVGAVAAFSALISYQHVRDVLMSWGYPDLSARVGPLVIDGLMAASGFALLVMAREKRVKPVDGATESVDSSAVKS